MFRLPEGGSGGFQWGRKGQAGQDKAGGLGGGLIPQAGQGG